MLCSTSWLFSLLILVEPATAHAQEAMEAVVVTGTRSAQSAQSLPMSIDRVDADRLREGRLLINLSESLQHVPGINIQSRSNYAQDLQISSRGFGARASFGVRGVRLFADGIPATQPDGQGQVSHFSLGSADRVEVLRGSFAVLYGNAAGGVIQIFTEDAPRQAFSELQLAHGGAVAQRLGLRFGGRPYESINGYVGIVGEVGRFAIEGFRPHSSANKTSGNLKLHGEAIRGASITRWSLIGNSIDLFALDPLGLTQADFSANPDATAASALQFNTRKSTRQSQLGGRLEHQFAKTGLFDHSIEFMAYAGERAVTQFLAIPVATQNPATHPGGVIDLDRRYQGFDLRYRLQAARGRLVAGIQSDQLTEFRRGYENFMGTNLGVLGRLRRDEFNLASNLDAYVQVQWRPSPALHIDAGLRRSQVEVESKDRYIIPGRNPDDSGTVRYQAVTPALGLSYHFAPNANGYLSIGKGFETPTLNELSYRPGGLTGLNLSLLPSSSLHAELGLKVHFNTGLGRVRLNTAIFNARTDNELSTVSNSGGRATFQNVGKTHRQGVELSLNWRVNEYVETRFSHTAIKAVYLQAFDTCTSIPCVTPTGSVAAGNKLPGLPGRSTYLDLRYKHPSGMIAALEHKQQGKIFVNDLNTEAARPYSVTHGRLSYTWSYGALRLAASGAIENIFNRRYAGSVIVNESNRRFFEPAPGRSWLLSLAAIWT